LPSSGALQRAAYLMIVLREYEDFYNIHRPHRTLKQAAPLWPLPDTCPI
jgi:putative transposase